MERNPVDLSWSSGDWPRYYAIRARSCGAPCHNLRKSRNAFKLQDQTGKWHSLSDYKGKWVVLYFYPKDNTPGCTTQACEFHDNIFAYRETGAVILGVLADLKQLMSQAAPVKAS